MKIVCPHCNFSREIPDGQVPDRPVKVTCPKCQQGFSFDKTAVVAAGAFDTDFAAASEPAATPEETNCPACGLLQPVGDTCAGCGVIYAKWTARQEAREPSENQGPAPGEKPRVSGARIVCNACGAVQPPGSKCISCGAILVATATTFQPPFAGFWVRFLACMIDSLILGAAQFVIGLLLGLAGGAAGDYAGSEGFVMLAISWLCSMAVSVTYYVFFTGYNGQTPGKMALRIQVVRTDGTPMSYGRAFLREIPGKFVSAIILGIGYLMVGFDRQKQGLHDKIADTYVVKL